MDPYNRINRIIRNRALIATGVMACQGTAALWQAAGRVYLIQEAED
jgi:hypothetical protein